MIDLDRLTQLVIERVPRLTLYARQWLDSSSADDVVQDALTSLLMQRTTPDDPIAWMYRTVRNAAIDHARVSWRFWKHSVAHDLFQRRERSVQ